MKNNRQMVEIWGDVVELKSLILSISISTILTMTAYLVASDSAKSRQLFFGLSGAVLGFIISTVLIKPKRDINIEK